MKSKNILLFEAPSNLGLKLPVDENEPGAKFLPNAFIKAGILKNLKLSSTYKVEPPLYSCKMDLDSGILNTSAVREYAIKLSASLQPNIKQNNFILTLGGDCSILIGIMHALKKMGQYALFFIDGHTDFMPPEFSTSKQAAAMELALVTGNGYPGLSNIDGLQPYVKENNVWCLGNRELEHKTIELISNTSIHYIDINTFRMRKTEDIISEFLLNVLEKNLDGFWIHLDVDVLNDSIMPCVDSRQPGGLTYKELENILRPLLNNNHAIGIDVTIFNPILDTDNKVANEFVRQFTSWF